MSDLTSMRALITGSSGFIGSHLADHLMAAGATVFGLGRVVPAHQRISQVLSHRVFAGDLLDESFLKASISEIKPTHVFHLAGVLNGAIGGSAAQYNVNVLGTIRLLDCLMSAGLSPLVLIASSSAVYGAPLSLPISEEHELRPLTHYATSKVAQEMVGIQYYLAAGMRIVRARTFNIIGAGQSPSLLTSWLAQQVVQAEAGGERVIRVGNLSPRRDYTDVRDVVRAYGLLANSSSSGDVYNVCSGASHSVQECVEVLMKMAQVPLELEVEPSRIRKEEIADQVGSSDKLRQATGWLPGIAFEESVTDLLDYYRQSLRNGEEL
jgi:GDP-4-dehydro-6-deoxy-D-mannose reductase